VARARLLGFDGKTAKIENRADRGDVRVRAEAWSAEKERPPKWRGPPAPPRPESAALFAVTDFGASPEKEDNAAAFQAALDRAGSKRGGGTVYVPAGYYRFRNDIKVPSGVELRGCSDVPHHTVSDGSVLLVCHGAGEEDGTPFVSLSAGSGLRGLTFWYPGQPLKEPVPYPWTVRSLGRRCWLKDVTVGNAWQAVDFATHRSDGHFISYLAGSMYRRGLFVGNSRGGGWVEDVQFNPHYAGRLSRRLPRVTGEGRGDAGGSIIRHQQEHLEGIVFRDCQGEAVRGTFLFAARDGIAFRGRCGAQVLMHGSDACSRAAVLDLSAGGSVDFALAQLVTLGGFIDAQIVAVPGNAGDARFFNTQVWAGRRTALLEGTGRVRLEQFNTTTGPVEVKGGSADLVNGVFQRRLEPHVAFSGKASGRVTGTVFLRGALRVEGDAQDVKAEWNSVAPAQLLDAGGKPTVLASGFEAGEPEAVADTVARGGGRRGVSGNRCGAVERGDAHGGKRAVLLSGVSDDPAYSFVYQAVFQGPVFVLPDTVLTYWFKPLDENGRGTGLDLTFAEGRPLRERGATDAGGTGTFPGTKRGKVGEWTKITVPLGDFAGNTVTEVMAAYDTRRGGGRFEALFDDVRIGPAPAAR
jgi:hypothetical protein